MGMMQFVDYIMKKRNKLYNMDEARLSEILNIINCIRGSYTKEIENNLDKIENSIVNFKNQWKERKE
jgi:hypothetical protein